MQKNRRICPANERFDADAPTVSGGTLKLSKKRILVQYQGGRYIRTGGIL